MQRFPTDWYPPAVCGSGAAVEEVHPPERCCWKRPFSSHIRSRRPSSDFLRSSLTFPLELWLLAVGCEAVRRGLPSRGLKIRTARLGLASLCGFTGSLKTNVPNSQCGCSLLNGEGRCRDALCFRVREWMETWTRLWCISLKLRRINDSFADSRIFGHYRLSRRVHVKDYVYDICG